MIPRRMPIGLLSSDQRQQYADLHAVFIATTGALSDHLQWHSSHGSGSDAHFLYWHRYFVRWLEDYLGAQGRDFVSPVPYWPSDTQIPAELSAGTVNTVPNVPTPSWATMAGGAVPAPLFGHTSLGQFKSSAELGGAIGASYHGTVHNTVGGTMATFSSPAAPIFYPWHGYVDHIWAEWQRHAAPQPVAIVRGHVGGPDPGALRINLFVRRADGNLWERYWDGTSWTWSDTGKAVFGAVAVLVRGDIEDVAANDVRINLFVQGADRRLWNRSWNGSTWTWTDTGKEVDGEPLVIARGDLGSPSNARLRANVFVRGADGNLWEYAWDGSWSWTDTGKAVSGNPVAVVHGDMEGVEADDVRIHLFVRGADHRLWERYWNGSTWSWTDTGMEVSDDPVALVRGSTGSPRRAGVRMNVFVRGMDGHLWERHWNGSSWTWIDTGRGVRGRVVALTRGNRRGASDAEVRINVFAQGTDGNLWERYWNGSSWRWVNTGRPVDGQPVALLRGNVDSVHGADIRINLLVPVLQTSASGGTSPHRHYDTRLWERYWNGAQWTWVDTGRNIRSTPAVLAHGDIEDVGTRDLRLHLWAAGEDGKLWQRSWNGSSWAWEDTGADVAI